jgi:hypothetical protein
MVGTQLISEINLIDPTFERFCSRRAGAASLFLGLGLVGVNECNGDFSRTLPNFKLDAKTGSPNILQKAALFFTAWRILPGPV